MKPKFCKPDSWCWDRGREARRTSGKFTGLERQKLEFGVTQGEII